MSDLSWDWLSTTSIKGITNIPWNVFHGLLPTRRSREAQNVSGISINIVVFLQNLLESNKKLQDCFSKKSNWLHHYKVVTRSDKSPSGEHAGRFNEIAVLLIEQERDKRENFLHYNLTSMVNVCMSYYYRDLYSC